MTPAQAASGELSEEGRPEGLGLGGADLKPQHFAPSVTVDPDGDDDGDRDDAARLTHLHIGGIDPQIGPVALDRPLQEGLDPAVDLLAQPADLALRDAAHPHRLDQIVDRAGRDAVDVGLLDDRRQGLLGKPSRLQEEREVAALAQLGDTQLDCAGAGLPVAVAIAVALGEPLGAPLAIGRAGQPGDLHLHQPLGGKADHLAQQIGVGGLLDQRLQVHRRVGHRSVPRIRLCPTTRP